MRETQKKGDSQNRRVAVIEKNAIENVVVQLSRYRDRDFVDLRVWNKALPGETGRIETPSKRGITLDVDRIPELIDALKQAEATVMGNSR